MESGDRSHFPQKWNLGTVPIFHFKNTCIGGKHDRRHY